jgi:hypothetical protein
LVLSIAAPLRDDSLGGNLMKSILLTAAALVLATGVIAQTETTATESATATAGEAKRAQFCTAVSEREPVDDITTLAAPAASVSFFTELIGMAGKTVTHKWSLDGQAMGDVAISVGADRWRCYSTKTLSATLPGTWTVQVVDDAGSTLAEKTLTVTATP